MSRAKLMAGLPDGISWGGTVALLLGSYFDQPFLTALGFGTMGFLVLAGVCTRDPLGLDWIPNHLRYVWSAALGSWLILAALGVTPLVCVPGRCIYVWADLDAFNVASAY